MARTLTDAMTRPFNALHQGATRQAPRCSAKRPVLKSRRTRKRLLVLGVPALGGAHRCGCHDDQTADRGESRCLWLPRVPWSGLGLPSCDSLHQPGYRALLPAALWAIRAEANSTWPVAQRGGWRSIATNDNFKLRSAESRVKCDLVVLSRPRRTTSRLLGRRRLAADVGVQQNFMMLSKRQLDDGGLDVETGLIGPAVFLDVWAVRDLSDDARTDLRNRLATALAATSGSLLVSTAWFTELEALQGDARTRAQALFTSLGAHWLLLNPVVSAAAAREARDELGAYLSEASLNAYVIDRSGELLRSNIDPHSVSDAEFFDLGRTLAWSATDPTAATTAAAQSQALKDAAMARAAADRDEQRSDRSAYVRLYPLVAFATNRMACAHNAVWREVTRRSLGRTWMRNDGFDVAHLVPALTIGGLIAVDSDWKDIGQAASADLPGGHVTLYRPGELEQLVADLEMMGSLTR
jgi:hypothetical protein